MSRPSKPIVGYNLPNNSHVVNGKTLWDFTNLITGANPLTGAGWGDVTAELASFKIYSATIYELSNSGYSGGHPVQSADVVDLMKAVATLNGATLDVDGVSNGVGLLMESPVLPIPRNPQLPSGNHITTAIEGFDPSFEGVIRYIKDSLSYEIGQGHLTTVQAQSMTIGQIAMDEPLFFAGKYSGTKYDAIAGVTAEAPQWSVDKVARLAARELNYACRVLGSINLAIQFGDIEPVGNANLITASDLSAWIAAFHSATQISNYFDSDFDTGTASDHPELNNFIPAVAQNLAFFEADVVWGITGWQANLEAISDVLDASGIPLDIIVHGNDNETDPVAWTNHALNGLVAVYMDENVNYRSLVIQNWSAAQTSLFDAANSDVARGTIANTARYTTLIDDVHDLYAGSFAGIPVTSYELYYSTRMLGNNLVSATALATQVAGQSAPAALLQSYAGSSHGLPTAADLAAGNAPAAAMNSSPVTNAQSLVPAGMALDTRSWFLVPGSGPIDLTDMGAANRLGSLYFKGATSGAPRAVTLPDGIVAAINVLPLSGGGNGWASIQGGTTADFVYLGSVSNIRYTIGNPAERVADATGTNRSWVFATAANAGATVIGANGTRARLEISTGGTIALPQADANVTVTLDAPSALTLNADSSNRVVLGPANAGGNVVTLGAAGQSAVLGDRGSVIAPSAAVIPATTIDVGAGTLTLTGGGTATLGANTALGTLVLTRGTADPAYNLRISNAPGGFAISGLAAGDAIRNAGSLSFAVKVPAADAGVLVAGNTPGVTLEVTTPGTIGVKAGNTNVTYQLDGPSTLFLNADPLARVVLGAGNAGHNFAGLGAAGQTVVFTNGQYSCIYAASSYVTAATALDGGGQGQLNLYSGGTVVLGANVIGMTQLLLYRAAGDPSFTLTLSPSQQGITVKDMTGGNTIVLGGTGEPVQNLGTVQTTVKATPGQTERVFQGGTAGLLLEVTAAGSFGTAGLSGNVVVQLDQPGTVYLNGDAQARVMLGAGNASGNFVGFGAAGQQAIFDNGKYSCAYVAADLMSSATVIRNSGNLGQLNLYHGGTVALGTNVTGMNQILLYREAGGPGYDLTLSSNQSGAAVTLATAADIIRNTGTGSILVKVPAADAGVSVVGDAGTTTLEITTGGTFALGTLDTRLLVKLDAPSMLALNAMQFVTVDASAGNSAVTGGAAGQSVIAGPGDAIIGTAAALDTDHITGFSAGVTIGVIDFAAASATLAAVTAGGSTTLTLTVGAVSTHLLLSGFSGAGTFHLAPYGVGGSEISWTG